MSKILDQGPELQCNIEGVEFLMIWCGYADLYLVKLKYSKSPGRGFPPKLCITIVVFSSSRIAGTCICIHCLALQLCIDNAKKYHNNTLAIELPVVDSPRLQLSIINCSRFGYNKSIRVN